MSCPDTFGQCEKHSKKEEALTKLKDGVKFDDVAREFSEDKARQGMGASTRVSFDFALKNCTRWIAWLESPVSPH